MAQKTFSPEEIAEKTGKSIHTVYRHLRSGQLDGDKFGGEWIVSREAVRKWLPAPLFEEYFGGEEGAA